MMLYHDDFRPARSTRYVWQSSSVGNSSDYLPTATEAVKDILTEFAAELNDQSLETFIENNETLKAKAETVQQEIHALLVASESETDLTKKAKETVFITWLTGLVQSVFSDKNDSEQRAYVAALLPVFGLNAANVLDQAGSTDNDQDLLTVDDIAESGQGVLEQVLRDEISTLLDSDPYKKAKDNLENIADYGSGSFLLRDVNGVYTFNAENWQTWLTTAQTTIATTQATDQGLATSQQAVLTTYQDTIQRAFLTPGRADKTLQAINTWLKLDQTKINNVDAEALKVLAAQFAVLKEAFENFGAYRPEQLIQMPETVDNPAVSSAETDPIVGNNLDKANQLYQLVMKIPGAPKQLRDQIASGVTSVAAMKQIYTTHITKLLTDWITTQRQTVQQSIIAQSNDPDKQQKKIDRYKKNLNFPSDLETFFVSFGEFGAKMKEWALRSLDVSNLSTEANQFINPPEDIGIHQYFTGTGDDADFFNLSDTTALPSDLTTKITALKDKDFTATNDSIAALKQRIATLNPTTDAAQIQALKEKVKQKQAFERQVAELAWTKFGLETVEATGFAAFVLNQGYGSMDEIKELGGLKVIFEQWDVTSVDGASEDDGFMAGLVPPGFMRQLNKFMRSGVGKWLGKLFGFSTSFNEEISGAEYAYLSPAEIDKLGQAPELNDDGKKAQQEQLSAQAFDASVQALNDANPADNTSPEWEPLIASVVSNYDSLTADQKDAFWKNPPFTCANKAAITKEVRTRIFASTLTVTAANTWPALTAAGLDTAFADTDFSAEALPTTPADIQASLLADDVLDITQHEVLKNFITGRASATDTVLSTTWQPLGRQLATLLKDDQIKLEKMDTSLQLTGTYTKPDKTTVELGVLSPPLILHSWTDTDPAEDENGVRELSALIELALDVKGAAEGLAVTSAGDEAAKPDGDTEGKSDDAEFDETQPIEDPSQVELNDLELRAEHLGAKTSLTDKEKKELAAIQAEIEKKQAAEDAGKDQAGNEAEKQPGWDQVITEEVMNAWKSQKDVTPAQQARIVYLESLDSLAGAEKTEYEAARAKIETLPPNEKIAGGGYSAESIMKIVDESNPAVAVAAGGAAAWMGAGALSSAAASTGVLATAGLATGGLALLAVGAGVLLYKGWQWYNSSDKSTPGAPPQTQVNE